MDDSSRKKLAFSASKDLIFSILALIVYNGVIQLIIYPGLNSGMGADAFGTVLYLLSVVSVMGAGFGSAASYSRMVARKNRTEKNGDYNVFLLIVAGISVVVTFVSLLLLKSFNVPLYLLMLFLMVITVIRYYADVEYRMNIRFRDYFFFFVTVSIGYLLGLAVYRFTGNWVFTILLGELFGILYTILRGKIFRSPFWIRSECFLENLKACFVISASNIISALILGSDRILLRLIVGAREVTVFYTASLIGKIAAMITTPLNGVIISYFTNYDIKLRKKAFLLVSFLMAIASVLGAFICTFFSRIFVKLMYPEVFEEAKELFFVANLGQILFFISGSLMVIVLSFTKEKLQLWINLIYIGLFMAIVIPMTCLMEMKGLAIGLIVVNMLRFVITAMFGLKYLKSYSG